MGRVAVVLVDDDSVSDETQHMDRVLDLFLGLRVVAEVVVLVPGIVHRTEEQVVVGRNVHKTEDQVVVGRNVHKTEDQVVVGRKDHCRLMHHDTVLAQTLEGGVDHSSIVAVIHTLEGNYIQGKKPRPELPEIEIEVFEIEIEIEVFEIEMEIEVFEIEVFEIEMVDSPCLGWDGIQSIR